VGVGGLLALARIDICSLGLLRPFCIRPTLTPPNCNHLEDDLVQILFPGSRRNIMELEGLLQAIPHLPELD
jgi:hypothetical protein